MKKFLVIGNMNAITYKEIFPLFQSNQIWWGTDCIRWFIMNEGTTKETKLNERGQRVAEGAISSWFTNLDHGKRHEPLDLYKKYTPEEYPHYDNYDAIEVSRVYDIPMDYDGVIGVPITFLDKYCPDQFEIIWQASGNTRVSAPVDVLSSLSYHPLKEDRGGCPVIDGKRMYSRILIRKKFLF